MRDDTFSKDKGSLYEKALSTLTERVEKLSLLQREIEDLKLEIKGIKLFIGRIHPEFKDQLPELLKKIKD